MNILLKNARKNNYKAVAHLYFKVLLPRVGKWIPSHVVRKYLYNTVVLTSGSFSSATFYCHSMRSILANMPCHRQQWPQYLLFTWLICTNQVLNQTSATNVTSSAFIYRKAVSVPKYPSLVIRTGILQWIYCLQANVNCRMPPLPWHMRRKWQLSHTYSPEQSGISSQKFCWQIQQTDRNHCWLPSFAVRRSSTRLASHCGKLVRS